MAVNIARLEDRLLVISEPVGAPAYDFDFDLHFVCTHPNRFREDELCVLRIGPVRDYAAEAEEKARWGVMLVNSAEEHHRASEVDGWYPYIAELTPRTKVFDSLPTADAVDAEFGWPVFVKGSRQTSKHDPRLAIADGPDAYALLCRAYRADAILHWQRPVIRELVALDPVPGIVPGKIAPSREFRTFWWRGRLVGHGQYWYQLPVYGAPDLDRGLEVAGEAARRVDVPFLVVDIARCRDGGWIVIECNDGQEAGYAGLPPQLLWRNILDTL